MSSDAEYIAEVNALLAAERERSAQLTDQLTVVQTRCTELLEQVRMLRVSGEMYLYQEAAMRTAVYPTNVGLAYTALGLAGEAGELANKVKKVYRDNGGVATPDGKQAIAEELGDVLWYVAAVATELGKGLATIADGNLKKLAKRKEEGKIHGSGDHR